MDLMVDKMVERLNRRARITEPPSPRGVHEVSDTEMFAQLGIKVRKG